MLLVMFFLLVESLVENLKWSIEDVLALLKKAPPSEGGWNGAKLLAMVVSVAAAVIFNIDAFAFFGFSTAVPYVGAVFTGIIGARGANFFHDVLEKAQQLRGEGAG